MELESVKQHLLLRKSILNLSGNNYEWVAKDPVVRYICPFLYYLSKEGYLEIDQPSIQISRAAYYQNKARWLLWEPVFHQILRIFHENGIETIPLKAFDYTHSLYPDTGLRAFSDIDLLVKPDKFLRAIQILLRYGFHLLEEDFAVLQKAPLKVSEVTLLSPQRCIVEIHQSILPVKNFFRYENAINLNHESIWQRSESYNNSDQIHSSLNLVDKIAHLCLHAATHGLSAQSPFTYLDIDCWIRAEGSNIQWAEFLEIVKKWKIRSAAYHSFQLCKQIYNTPFPPEVIQQLNPGFWAKWRLSLVYSFESYISHDLKKPGIRNPKWVRLMLFDQITDMLKILLGGLFPTTELRKIVYGKSVSLLSHWSRILSKITSPA